jgi:hypothetical protein
VPAVKPSVASCGLAATVKFVAERLAEDGTARDAGFGRWLLAELAAGRTELEPVLAAYAATWAFHRDYRPPG